MASLKPKIFIAKNGERIRLRSPQPNEGEQIIEIMKVVLKTSPHTLVELEEFNYTPEQEGEIIKDHLNHERKIMIVPYVLSVDKNTKSEIEKPVGMMNFAVGHRRRNSHLGIFGMSLIPEYRGQGVGTEMLLALINWAKETPGIEKIDLEVHSTNAHGIALYNKLGFEVEGTRKRGVKLAEGKYDNILEMSLFVK